MKSILWWQGFTDIDGVAYYTSDVGCEVDLLAKGRQLGTSLDGHSTFVEIGRVLNAYVYDKYTSRGKAVDLVGHSMGGLIIRAAVVGGQLGTPGFRPIDVEDAVTLGTPHLGTPWTAFCPLLGPQCAAIAADSPEMTWMRSVGNPQGKNGTDWTVGAALADELVPKSSAWGMGVDANHKLQTMAPEHLSMTIEPITVKMIGRALKYGTR
jgi:pimeloyl-ACP methyl ester carboxylesterase